jgi:hypothetical protein
MDRPTQETSHSVCSNIDHVIDTDVMMELLAFPNVRYAQHAAWNFCGYVWHDGELWHEQVWISGLLAESRSDKNLSDLIDAVNNDYGRD